MDRGGGGGVITCPKRSREILVVKEMLRNWKSCGEMDFLARGETEGKGIMTGYREACRKSQNGDAESFYACVCDGRPFVEGAWTE